MPRNKLFESWTFKLSMPKPFDDPNYSGLKDFGLSKYNVSGKLHKASLHAPTMRALLAYAKLVNTSEQGQDTDGLGTIGHQDNKFRIAEYKSANKTDCVVFNPNTESLSSASLRMGAIPRKPIPGGWQCLWKCSAVLPDADI